ncbi:MAG: ABC transporter ATP-binding protein [Oscillospiraceae bacterium]
MKGARCEADKELFTTFRSIIRAQSKYEEPYEEAHSSAQAAAKAADDLLLAIDKEAVTDVNGDCHELKTYAAGAVNHFVIRDKEKLKSVLSTMMKNAHKAARDKDFAPLKQTVTELRRMLQSALDAEKPDFFALGCYVTLTGKSVGDETAEILNSMTAGITSGEFMNRFMSSTRAALRFSAERSSAAMAKAIPQLEAAVKVFEGEMPAQAEAKKLATELSNVVEAAIDPLETVKDSAAYTFRVSLSSALDTYFNGITSNVKERKRFESQMAKYDKAVARGKTPNGKVVPLSLVDLEIAQESIVHVINNIIEQFTARIETVRNYDYEKRGETYLEWLRETGLGEIHHVTRSMAKDTAIRIMEQVGIPEARKRYRQYPFEFSGGMRQRIVIAISLTADPDILICDEPTTALDVTIQAQILELINNLKRERNLSVIFITHDLGVVANMADRIAVMYAGKIVEYGTSEDVFYHPAHPYTWALLASIPDLNSKEKLEAIPGTPPNMIYPPVGDAFAARNKYALEIDFEQQPPMFQISDTHYAATWLLHPNAPHVEMPEIVKERIARMSKMGGENNG